MILIVTEEVIIEIVIATETDEADNIINPMPKLSEIKYHLNVVIRYAEDNNDENIFDIMNI